MWLKAKIMNKLLAMNKISRLELARELGCSACLLDRIIDGRDEASVELARMLIAAFGAADMIQAIDWRRTVA